MTGPPLGTRAATLLPLKVKKAGENDCIGTVLVRAGYRIRPVGIHDYLDGHSRPVIADRRGLKVYLIVLDVKDGARWSTISTATQFNSVGNLLSRM